MSTSRQGKSTGRRRPNARDGKRTERVEIWLSPEERKRIQVLARNTGVSVPHMYELAVWAGDSQTAMQTRLLRDELRTTWRAMGTALNNINQMARYANTEHHLHPETDAVRAQLVDVLDQLQSIIDRTPNG